MELRVVFDYEGMSGNSLFEKGLKELMSRELVEFYNEYADESNERIENWNAEFDSDNPGYFEERKGWDVWDLIEYNNFMIEKSRQLLKELKFNQRSKIINFDIGSELNLIGYLKLDPSKKIQFFLKEV